MNISWSRWLTILAALGAAASATATLFDQINPKYGVAATLFGTAVAAFNERIQGGASKTDGGN